MITLAYGEYSTWTLGMFQETLPFVLRITVHALTWYAIGSVLSECVKKVHVIGMLAYIVGFYLIVPSYGVMGAWGPAHVGLRFGFWAWPAFGALLLVKVIGLHAGLVPRTKLSLARLISGDVDTSICCAMRT